MSEWQPIETAPKGTKVLVYSPDRCANCPPEAGGAITAWHDGEYWCNGRLETGEIAVLKHAPTHWMPLPQPPGPHP